jgi:hypothetical protein
MLTAAGLHSPHWHRLYAVIIQAVTATKSQPTSKNADWRRGNFFMTASFGTLIPMVNYTPRTLEVPASMHDPDN